MDYPEVKRILQELDDRVATLESLVEQGVVGASNEAAPTTPQDEQYTVIMTPQHKEAISGLSSNVRGLIHSLDQHLNDRQQQHQAPAPYEDSFSDLRRIAKTQSKKKLLNNLLGPEVPTSPYHRRKTFDSAPVDMMEGEGVGRAIPKELLRSMMTDDGQSDEVAYLAYEYGGVELPHRFTLNGQRKKKKKKSMKEFAKSVCLANTFVGQMKANVGKSELEYLPKEFTRLQLSDRKRLAEMLSWENLKQWGFNSFEVESLSTITLFRRSELERNSLDLSERLDSGEDLFHHGLDQSDIVESSRHGCPIVLIGWAILASPYAQLAMARNVEDQELIDESMRAIQVRSKMMAGKAARSILHTESLNEDEGSNRGGDSNNEKTSSEVKKCAWRGGYFLSDEFEVAPRAICRFLRNVEKEYSPRDVNPYHNNIHAADVIQSTHALLQMGGSDMAIAYTSLETFAIILAAALHDIQHPGVNNNYQVNKRTSLALTYNDNSVLENYHASRASHLLEGLDDKGSDTTSGEGGSSILGRMNAEQQKTFRTSMIRSILSTDMSRHFSEVAKIERHVSAIEDEALSDGRPLLAYIGKDAHAKLREKLLPFILHLADISNPAKSHDVSLEWADCCYDEFFSQGDREVSEELPISPLCDRKTTKKAEGQVGFMTFVIKPAFALLARVIPEVEGIVLTQLEENLIYWSEEKERLRQEAK